MQNKSTKAMLTIISCFMLIVIADFLTAKTVKNRILQTNTLPGTLVTNISGSVF
ncbi:MAG: hypothetical protein PUA62_03130 [Lachnospiraceae bacterium]|nr:hypothetical protein [Lachnospiraceae bacterium]